MRQTERRRVALFVGAVVYFALFVPGRAGAQTPAPPAVIAAAAAREITLPSALLSGNATVDTIHVRLYPAENVTGDAPAVVLLPPTGSDESDPAMQRIARFLARNGVHAALLTLPYHGSRKKPGLTPGEAFIGYDVDRNARAFLQSASDVSTVVTYLQTVPGVDKTRIAISGISLGAIVCHLAMGKDARIGAGVAILGSGNLPDLYRHSVLSQIGRLLHPSPVRYDADARLRLLSPADPLTFTDQNRPRRVLMVQAARDQVIPPRDATQLWEALGRPPIRWVDTNHFALNLASGPLENAALAYLRGVWAGKTDNEIDATLPRVSAPLFKAGMLTQFGGGSQLGLTPAVSWQFAPLGTQKTHTSLFYADVGLTGRGPFVGVGITANAFIDIGFASRITHSVAPPRPYIGFHLAY